MLGRVLALLLAIAEIVRQVMKQRERNRAQIEAKQNEEELQEIERDPAEWFAQHFGGNATIVVRTCDHDDGVDADELRGASVSDPDPATEADANCDDGG